MATISSATIVQSALVSAKSAQTDLETVLAPEYSDWTYLQGAESNLLEALVAVRIAKIGVLRRNPSFDLPTYSRCEADISGAVSNALDVAMEATKADRL